MTEPRALVLPGARMTSPAAARDFVPRGGPPSEAGSCRLVICGRPPGGTCRRPPRRRPVDLAQHPSGSGLPGIDPVSDAVSAQGDAALNRATDQINGADAGVRLYRRPDKAVAPIRLPIRSRATFALIEQAPGVSDPSSGMAPIPLRPAGRITGARILTSSDIPLTKTGSAGPEALIQSPGPVCGIEKPACKRPPVFAQRARGVTTLAGLAAIALRLRYPPCTQAMTDP
jgi:hypothetical protein